LGLAKASDLFAAGVDIHGVHDWNVVVKNFIPNYDANKEPSGLKWLINLRQCHISTLGSPLFY
jgi:hypothetical protein